MNLYERTLLLLFNIRILEKQLTDQPVTDSGPEYPNTKRS